MNRISRLDPRGVPQTEIHTLIKALCDEASAESPATFPADVAAARQPGLYSWWCDAAGRKALSATLGCELPSLIYAGLAGATKWPSGRAGTATLYSRIRQMHLASKIDFSTFRWTLAALLKDSLGLEHVGARKLSRTSETRLTDWMLAHLRVRTVPYNDRATLGAAEDAVLAALDPPLNLMGMPSSPIRERLTALRAELARPPATLGATLVIVPCGVEKIWREDPARGPTPARNAYTSAYFQKNRAYAEAFGERWVVLSAKYGFMDPEFVIPSDYNVTFKDPSTRPISPTDLKQQVHAMRLDRFRRVIGLGGATYQSHIRQAFEGVQVSLEFPFAGLPIGQAMQATAAAVGAGSARDNASQIASARSAPARSSARTSAGRYAPLRQWLAQRGDATVRTDFATLERIVGTPLPESARRHRAWWSNNESHSQARAWLSAGFAVSSVDLSNARVVYRRT